MQLNEALDELNNAIREHGGESRPWYEAMRDEDAG
jgi:hypothetical protein